MDKSIRSPNVQPNGGALEPLGYSILPDYRPARRRRTLLLWLGCALVVLGMCVLRPQGRVSASTANQVAAGCIVSGVVLYLLHRRQRKGRVPPFWRLQMACAVILCWSGLMPAVMSAKASVFGELLRWPWGTEFATGVLIAAVGGAWYALCNIAYRRSAIRPRVDLSREHEMN